MKVDFDGSHLGTQQMTILTENQELVALRSKIDFNARIVYHHSREEQV